MKPFEGTNPVALPLGCNDIKSLSGIETYAVFEEGQAPKVATTLNPYQGLKRRTVSDLTWNELVATTLNPYQGLKPLPFTAGRVSGGRCNDIKSLSGIETFRYPFDFL